MWHGAARRLASRAEARLAPRLPRLARGASSEQTRHDIGVGPGASGLSVAEWSRRKNANKGPPVSAGVGRWAPEAELQVKAERIPGIPDYMPALLLRGIFTAQECLDLIAAVPTGGPGYLGKDQVYELYNDRVVRYRFLTHDEALADRVLQRVRAHIPEELDGGKLVGVNPGFRFVHHDRGGHQAGHIDGREPVEALFDEALGGWVQSRLSLQIYLSGGFKGGAFAIMEPDAQSEGGYRVRHVHQPSAGDAVLFYQERLIPPSEKPYELFHEARDVLEGDKFACRTMVDYVFPDAERARLSNLADDVA